MQVITKNLLNILSKPREDHMDVEREVSSITSFYSLLFWLVIRSFSFDLMVNSRFEMCIVEVELSELTYSYNVLAILIRGTKFWLNNMMFEL